MGKASLFKTLLKAYQSSHCYSQNQSAYPSYIKQKANPDTTPTRQNIDMIYKIASLALLIAIIFVNQKEAKWTQKWKYCTDCTSDSQNNPINKFCCKRPESIWKKEPGKKICCEFPKKRKHQVKWRPAKPVPGLLEPCIEDKDCQKWNSTMACVHKRHVSQVKYINGTSGTQALATGYDQKIDPGQCQLESFQKVVDAVKGTASLSTLFNAVKSAGLVDKLMSGGPFTVFAPNNDAFNKLPADLLKNLMKPGNEDQLKKLILRHVVPHIFMAVDMYSFPKDTKMTMYTPMGKEEIRLINGQRKITIKSSKVSAEVKKPDITTSNGVVHIIDNVLL